LYDSSELFKKSPRTFCSLKNQSGWSQPDLHIHLRKVMMRGELTSIRWGSRTKPDSRSISTSFENDQATAQNYYCLDAVARHGQIPAGEKARMKHATTK
jgi:hypothetical protein